MIHRPDGTLTFIGQLPRYGVQIDGADAGAGKGKGKVAGRGDDWTKNARDSSQPNCGCSASRMDLRCLLLPLHRICPHTVVNTGVLSSSRSRAGEAFIRRSR